jgi:hypothetical protein
MNRETSQRREPFFSPHQYKYFNTFLNFEVTMMNGMKLKNFLLFRGGGGGGVKVQTTNTYDLFVCLFLK